MINDLVGEFILVYEKYIILNLEKYKKDFK